MVVTWLMEMETQGITIIQPPETITAHPETTAAVLGKPPVENTETGIHPIAATITSHPLQAGILVIVEIVPVSIARPAETWEVKATVQELEAEAAAEALVAEDNF